ncbi:hypothetical protein GCM10009678_64230 [Actinomadura kijaniata]|uniref:Crotonobetainyl-CoA:carnitine CoA-transferase CaiB-like acyl-CoA transferase n=1 Tax=Actinomadura namibiensis TaxID=182080 RepID=A0A7W3M006_ACTNM|nr:CoA transferase [Actinomadura namibiensis]MBA8957354.1 crotonobetainyl-CoA:carnitine CoA-transferase CaiB-like acyl-CoA transferase [Actinomadura namibiensis]
MNSPLDGGGGTLPAFGVVSAPPGVEPTGKGRVVDAAMVDGVTAMMAMFYPLIATGGWAQERGTNLLDSGAHFYAVYETSDGRYVSVAAIEPRFYDALLDGLGLDPAGLPDQMDASCWPSMRRRFAEIFRTRTRDEWCDVLEHSDACFAPVLAPLEALAHPHHLARRTFQNVNGVPHPAPAPRFGDAGPRPIPPPAPRPGEYTAEVLAEAGLPPAEIQALTTPQGAHHARLH